MFVASYLTARNSFLSTRQIPLRAIRIHQSLQFYNLVTHIFYYLTVYSPSLKKWNEDLREKHQIFSRFSIIGDKQEQQTNNISQNTLTGFGVIQHLYKLHHGGSKATCVASL